jgi:hypothetical protein
VAPGGEIALAPVPVLPLPALGQAPHGRRRRQARRPGREPRRQGPRELTGRGAALAVGPRRQPPAAPGPAWVGRRDRRGGAKRLFTSPAPPRSRALGRRTARGPMPPVGSGRSGARPPRRAHRASPALPVGGVGAGGEGRRGPGRDRPRQQAPPGALAQHRRQQRVVRDARSWPGQADAAIPLRGGSFPVTSTLAAGTPPPTSATMSGCSPPRQSFRLCRPQPPSSGSPDARRSSPHP